MSEIPRKGITPIIAVVLLLMMTVAAAGLAYTWVIGVQTSIQERVGQEALTLGERRPLLVVQESGNVTNAPITLLLQNPGTDWNIRTEGLIVRVDGTVCGTCGVATGTSPVLAARSTKYINVTGVTFPSMEKRVTITELIFIDGVRLSYTCRNDANLNNTNAVC